MNKSLIALSRRLLGRDALSRFGNQLAAMEKRLARTEAIVDILLEEKEYVSGVGVGLNGQAERKRIVASVCDRLGPDLVIETGTFFGFTSGFFARDLGLPVKTSEIAPRHYAVAKRILRNCPNVEIRLSDSLVFLRDLSRDSTVTSKTVLFYLDAHWYDSLPLKDELEIILSNWKSCCILIDDFAVPWDDGYGFDDYGPGKVLSLKLIEPIVSRHRLAVYFPSVPSSQETGGRRGYVFLVRESSAGVLDDIAGLRRYR